MKLTELEMARIRRGIREADRPIEALIAALRLTFLALGAGDLAAEHSAEWKIDGREWPLNADQWVEIGDLLVKRTEELRAPGMEQVNLALDWMNLGPTTETETRAIA